MKQYAKYFACILIAIFASVAGSAAQTAAPAAPKNDSQSLITNFPIPVGEVAHGIRFPYWENKTLKMFFNVDMMERKDLEHIQMTNAKIVTYADDQKPDLTLLLPVSVLDLNTRILTTDKCFVLKRADLELMGDSLQLDTLKREATIVGKIKMIIYNFQEPDNKGAAHE